MLLLFRATGAAPLVGIDLRNCLEAIYPTLNAAAAADLVWWTDEELYQWLDEAAKRFARHTGGFIARDTSLFLVPGLALYTLPSGHCSTIHVSAGNRAMRATNTERLEAKDSTWPDSVAAIEDPNPQEYVHDGEGLESIRLYKTPAATAAGLLAIVMHRAPAAIGQGGSVVPLPGVWREYFTYYALGEARSKESKGAMPEVGAWFREIAGVIEEVAKDYYGGAQ